MAQIKAAIVTVLVVDDEDADRKAVVRALHKEGFGVFEATDYSDAMAVFDLHRETITLLIADLALPDGNGCALAIAIRKQQQDLRVLFISFDVGAESCKYYGLTLPDLHFLKKPFTATNLLNRVRQILKSAEPFPKLAVPKTLTSSG